MGEPMIEVSNLTYSYHTEGKEERKVLNNLSFSIEEGSFVAILGHNGSGKSTLAKLLTMILTPESGVIRIAGREITSDSMTEEDVIEVRKEIGMVFQNPDNQLVATVVEEDIAFGPENLGMDPQEIRKRVDDALACVGMSEFARHAPHQLSGGQKQRIAIAGIIAMQPRCIIFDESTAMLDPIGRREVMDTIRMLNREKGITILHITHNMDEVCEADRVLVLSEGELVLDGTPQKVFSEVEKLRGAGLEVPQVQELFLALKESGVKLKSDILNEKDGADVLASYWKTCQN